MKREYGRWTDETIAKLIELWRARVSVGTIAKRLGHSKQAVFMKVHRLRQSGIDLPHRNNTSEPGWITRRNLAKGAA